MNSGSESEPTVALPRHLALEGARLRLQDLRRRQHLVRVRQELSTGRGQHHAGRGSVEEGDVEFVLQRLDLGRQRRLADVQLLGGPGQVPGFGDGGKTS